MSDLELEMLKLKKLKELAQKNRISASSEAKPQKPHQPNPSEIVEKYLVGRAKEVLEAAKAQHPTVAQEVVAELAELIQGGVVNSPVTGEMVQAIFSRIGYPVRLPTRIFFQKRGKIKTLDEKLKEAIE